MSEIKWSPQPYGIVGFNNRTGQLGIDQAGIGILASVTPLINQGPGSNERIGNQIRYKYFKFRMQIYINPINTASYTILRVVVFVPLIPLITTTTSDTYSSIFDVASTGGSAQHLATVDNKTVRVLYDKMFYMGMTNDYLNSGYRSATTIKFGRAMFNRVNYRSNGDNLIYEPKDQIYMFMTWPGVATQGTVNAWEGNFQLFTRMSYRDA